MNVTAEAKDVVPPHIPKELLIDFDIYDPPGGSDDPHMAWRRLRNGPDIQWTPLNGGHWILTRAEDIEFFWRNPDPFSSSSVNIPAELKPDRMLPLEADPPEHTAYRALINLFFTPKAVAPLEREARQLTAQLIDGFYARGECEFISDFSMQLPITIFLHLVELPLADRDVLLRWTSDGARSKVEATRTQAYASIAEYLDDMIVERRTRHGEDMFSRVIRSEVFGRPLTDVEIKAFCSAILFGGLDTVVSSLGFVAHFMATSDRHRRQLAEKPELIPGALNELFRRFSVTTNARLLARDFVYKGIEFKKGDRVSLGAPLHGLDERKFENPLEVDFSRSNSSDLATFGFGPHRCPGSFLARTELKVFLEEWLKRIPDFGVKPGDKVVFNAGRINSVNYLPLVWKVN